MPAKKTPNLLLAFIPLLVLVAAAAGSIFVWKVGMFVPLICGIAAAAAVGYSLGYRWDEMQQFLSFGVTRVLPAIFILFVIGSIVGTWILSGVIPTLIYYGLAIISPVIFVPTVALTTGIIAMTLGSSFTSIATVGLAFMAVGQGLGFPPAIVAGAVISGAFLGDKLSPLSDTTNVAPAMVDTDLFSHVRHMLWDTIPAFLVSLFFYWLIGLQYSSNAADVEEIAVIMAALREHFTIHPLLLFLPFLTVFLMLRRYPALPALISVSVLGGLAAVLFQGSTLTDVVQAMTRGFSIESGVKSIDSLLNRGGLTSMLGTIGLLIVAAALGGILESTGAFKTVIDRLTAKVESTGHLILSTVISTFVVAFASGAQFLAVILPGRGFAEAYKKRGLDTKNLSRCVEAAGTVGINLVPWGVPAVFSAGMLGVAPGAFIPFVFFAYLVPLINVIYGYTGLTIAKKTYPEAEDTAA